MEAKSQSIETMLMFLKLNVMETTQKLKWLLKEKPHEASLSNLPLVSSEEKPSHQDKESKLRYVGNPNVPAAEKRTDSLPPEKEKILIGKLRTMAGKIDKEMN